VVNFTTCILLQSVVLIICGGNLSTMYMEKTTNYYWAENHENK